MRPSSATSRSVRVALRAAALLAVLVGICGMPALASHGADRMQTSPDAVLSVTGAVTAPTALLSMPEDRMRVSGSASTSEAADASNSQHHDGGMSMAGMCVAILMVGLAAIYLWMTRQPLRRPGWLVPRLHVLPTAVSRDPDPPSLIALSIQRC